MNTIISPYMSPTASNATWLELSPIYFRFPHPLEVAYFLDLLDYGEDEIEYVNSHMEISRMSV